MLCCAVLCYARYDGNHADDTGAIADVVPYDGIGGNPGCPVWQVAYVVIAHALWKHYGDAALPTLRDHYGGLLRLMGWFDRHADPSDGLLVTKCGRPPTLARAAAPLLLWAPAAHEFPLPAGATATGWASTPTRATRARAR
jgi:hypothetical protein